MMIIGLTGGIGSGKSTVSDYLKLKNYPIFDADIIAREIVMPGTQGLFELIAEYGPGILHEDGSLNRKKLGDIVFNDAKKLERLNKILHTRIYNEIEQEIKKAEIRNELAVFIDAPLLFESGLDKLADEVWLVDVSDQIQVMRLMKRDGITESEAQHRISLQMPAEKKRALADVIIDNTGTVDELYQKVEHLLQDKLT